jgi:hypothetical protein
MLAWLIEYCKTHAGNIYSALTKSLFMPPGCLKYQFFSVNLLTTYLESLHCQKKKKKQIADEFCACL